jgi:hypothetical protein
MSDRLLPDNMADAARNTKLYSGELRAWRLPEVITDLGGTAPISAYKLKYNDADVWMSWDVDVDVVKAPLTNDAYDRYYWSGDDAPKVNSAQRIANSQDEYKLGVPEPLTTPVVTAPQSGGDTESRVYAYTYESAFGEEGPPIFSELVSGPSAYYTEEVTDTISSNTIANPTVVTLATGQTYETGDQVVITGSNSSPSINGTWTVTRISDTQFTIPVNVDTTAGTAGSVTMYASRYAPWTVTLPSSSIQDAIDRNVSNINVYRTVSGFASTDFFFVEQVAYPYTSGSPAGTYSDSSKNSAIALNDTLESTSWNVPPEDLLGLIAHPNGFLVGFTGSDVYMSVPYRPHAWPSEYITSVDYPIVGLGLIGNTIVIMTEVYTYAMSGIRPESMTLIQSNLAKPCVSKRSIVNFNQGVMYESNDGIMITNGSRIDHATLNLMVDTDWEARYGSLSPIDASSHGDWYLAYCSCGTGFLLDFRNPNAGLIELEAIEPVAGNFIDDLTGETYIIKGTKVFQFDPLNTPTATYVWRSKEFEFPEPVNLGAMQVKYTVPDDLEGTDTEYVNAVYDANADLISSGELGTINNKTINGLDEQHLYSNHKAPINGSGIVPIEPLQNIVPILNVNIYSRDTYDEKTLMFTYEITDQEVIRLPSGFKSDIWQVEITGNVNVYSVAMASTGLELKQV